MNTGIFMDKEEEFCVLFTALFSLLSMIPGIQQVSTNINYLLYARNHAK